MYVRAFVAGHIEQASAHVTVQCPGPDNKPDPKFDAPKVRAGMAAAWANTHAEQGEAGSLEQVGLILQDPTTGEYSYSDITQYATTTTCSSDLAPDFYTHIPTGTKIVGYVHTHPHAAGSKSYNCPSLAKGTPYWYGPSGKDWDFSVDLATLPPLYTIPLVPIDGYIIDPGYSYRYNGVTTPSKQFKDVKWHKYNPKSPDGCK
jgi:hypothetical protein